MENFIFGIQGVFLGFQGTLDVVTQYGGLVPFILGFVSSTLIHGFVIADDPRMVPMMVMNDAAVSFEKMNTLDGGHYQQSYSEHTNQVQKIKSLFRIAIGLLVLLLLFALIRVNSLS